MFKFLLEGKIGEILAPISGLSNQVFLSIQHGRNDEFNQLVQKSNFDLSSCTDCGYSALHVACRYGNGYAFDYILSKGVNIDLPDSGGNTPLHYAAKYGQVELCKALVGKGCDPRVKNLQGASPYDVATSHIIRQYLLPLQFQPGNDDYGGLPSIGSGYQQQEYALHNPNYIYPAAPQPPPSPNRITSASSFTNDPTPGIGNTNNNDNRHESSGSNSSGAPPPPIISSATPLNLGRPISGSMPSFSTSQEYNNAASAGAVSSESSSSVGGSVPSTPPTPQTPLATGDGSSNISRSTSRPPVMGNTRLIRADGFHSSASDPALQAKYGHIKERVNIAPPPIASFQANSGITTSSAPPGPPQYSMYSNSQPSGPLPPTPIQNRYVVYDIHSDPAVGANSQTTKSSTTYGFGFGQTNSTLPTTVPPPNAPYFPFSSSNSAPSSSNGVPVAAHSSISPPLPSSVSYGNLGSAGGMTQGNVTPVTPPVAASTMVQSRPALNISSSFGNLSNSSQDSGEVISANSTSSAVM